MKFKNLSILVAASTHTSLSLAQSTDNPSDCVKGSGVTAFPNCNYYNNALNKCSSLTVDALIISCLCNQALFSSLFNCENEQRLCFGNENIDGYFQPEIDTLHSICDSQISFTLTTPSMWPITASFNENYCTTVFSSCAGASQAAKFCSISYTGQEYLSCFCQPSILSMEYTCEFLGNTSCVQTSAAVTNLVAYGHCSNLPAVLGSIDVSVPASSNHLTTSLMNTTSSTSASSFLSSVVSPAATPASSSVAITQPVLPSPMSSTPSTASPKPSIGVVARVPTFILGAACWGSIFLAILVMG